MLVLSNISILPGNNYAFLLMLCVPKSLVTYIMSSFAPWPSAVTLPPLPAVCPEHTHSHVIWTQNVKSQFPGWALPVLCSPTVRSTAPHPQQSTSTLNFQVFCERWPCYPTYFHKWYLLSSLSPSNHLTLIQNREFQPLRRIFHELMGDSLAYGIFI